MKVTSFRADFTLIVCGCNLNAYCMYSNLQKVLLAGLATRALPVLN